MALVNGFGEAPWGIAPWGDPTGFDGSGVTIAAKNSAQQVGIQPANSAQKTDAQPANSSTGIAVTHDGQ